MGGHHSHAHAAGGSATDTEAFVADRRVVVILLAVLIPILIATGVALVVLWPHGTPPDTRANTTAVAGDRVSGVVRSSSAKTCEGESSDRLPDGTIPATATCASVVARIESGPDQGKDVTVNIPPQVYRAGISPGDHVDLTRFSPQDTKEAAAVDESNPDALPNGNVYAWVDFSRGLPLTALAVLFAHRHRGGPASWPGRHRRSGHRLPDHHQVHAARAPAR